MSPSSVLYSGPGDHTAGIIWLYDQYSKTPWWRFSPNTAFPWGDKLWDPVYVISQISYVSFWLASKLAGGSVAGYNLFTIGAIGLSFLVTAAFTYKRIIRNAVVAAIAGYFAAFTTMVLGKLAVGHVSYLFGAAYTVGGVWILSDLLAGRSVRRNAIFLGLLAGSLFYFDPYFLLIVPVVLAAAFCGSVAYGWWNAGKFSLFLQELRSKKIITSLLLAILVALVTAAPSLLYLRLHSSAALTDRSQINIKGDAAHYGAKFSDYLLPSPYNPVFPSELKEVRTSGLRGANESLVLFIGYSLVAAALLIWCIILYQLLWRRNEVLLRRPELRLFTILSAVTLTTFYFSLPALYRINGIRIYTPADLLTDLTYAWRIFSTFDAAFHPALIVTVVTGGVILYRTILNRRWFLIASVAIVPVLFLETLPRMPFSLAHYWDYNRSLPSTYDIVKERPDIQVLAEYPIREQPHYRGSVYITAQQYHHKKLFNSYIAGSPTTWYREAVMDLASPQTLPILRAFGVDTLQVNWNKQQYPQPGTIPATLLVNTEYTSVTGKENIDLYDIRQGPKYRFALIIDRNQRPENENLTDNIRYRLSSGDVIEVVDLCRIGIPVALDCNQSSQPDAIRFTFSDALGTISLMPTKSGSSEIFISVAADGQARASITAPGKYKVSLPGGKTEATVTNTYVEQAEAR